MKLLDGKKLAHSLKQNIRLQAEQFMAAHKRPPHLAAILVGDNGASVTYVNNKIKACRECGLGSSLIRLDDTVRQNELMEEISRLNDDDHTDGILVQLPLPSHISPDAIASAIHPLKDVDGFHPLNLGRLAAGLPCFKPATPLGVQLILENYGIETKGRHVVIIGRSNIVGRPLSILLSSPPFNATVTLCHSQTVNLPHYTRQADILIAAAGIPGFVNDSMVSRDAVVIDVGITRTPDSSSQSGFRIRGDVDFEAVSEKCRAITPVPGGVGPMTITALLLNSLKAARREIRF